jgi:hypothetical protein
VCVDDPVQPTKYLPSCVWSTDRSCRGFVPLFEQDGHAISPEFYCFMTGVVWFSGPVFLINRVNSIFLLIKSSGKLKLSPLVQKKIIYFA